MKERERKRKERLKEQATAEKAKKENVETAAHQKDKASSAEAFAPKERNEKVKAAARHKEKTKDGEVVKPSDRVTAELGFARDIPAEESNTPPKLQFELQHGAETLNPGPPPPPPRRRPRQVCAWRGACLCLY